MGAPRALALLLAVAAFLVALLVLASERTAEEDSASRAIVRDADVPGATGADPLPDLATPGSADTADGGRVSEAIGTDAFAADLDGLGDLRPLNGILLHAGSKLRAPERDVILRDANGVSVAATSDAEGRIVVHDLLLAGKIRVYTCPYEFSGRPTRKEMRSFELSIPEKGIHVVDHTGGAGGELDVWQVDLDTRIGLSYGGTETAGAKRVAFVTADASESYAEFVPETSESLEFNLRPMEVELIQVPLDCHVPTWRAREIGQTSEERRLVVAEVHQGNLRIGEIRPSDLDVVGVTSVQVPLFPLFDTDRPSLEGRFGARLGGRIGQLVAEARAEYEKILAAHFTGISVRGAVASQSGNYREPVKIEARPARDEPLGPNRPERTGVATVQWDDEGRGTFHIQHLDAGRYELRMLGSTVPLTTPLQIVVAAPSDSGARALFTVLDQVPTWPVAVRAATADGVWIGGFRASIEAPFRGRVLRGGVVAPFVFDQKQIPPGAIVLSEVPEGSEFRVDVSLKGYRSTTLHWNDFTLEGKRLMATAVLFEGQDPLGSGR